MKKYIGTKIIKAQPMNRGDYNDFRGWAIPEDENPEDEGYLVQYEDGHISWSPKSTFERSYLGFGNLDFGAALKMLKLGHKVARSGWNGKGMFVYLVEGQTVDAKDLRNEAKKHYPTEGPIVTGLDLRIDHPKPKLEVKICSHIDMKAADGSIVVGWLASQTDMLAEDWTVID